MTRTADHHQPVTTIPGDIFELLSPLHKRAALLFEKRGELRIDRNKR